MAVPKQVTIDTLGKFFKDLGFGSEKRITVEGEIISRPDFIKGRNHHIMGVEKI